MIEVKQSIVRSASDGHGFDSAPNGWKWYLVEYEYNGSKWSLDLLATDDDDASARVESLFNAKLLGQRMMTIPAFAGAGVLARSLCAVRNFLWK